MNTLKYKVIKSEEQYDRYCQILEDLVFEDDGEEKEDEIELLTLLIENWDERHRMASELDPVEFVRSLMEDHGLNQTELAQIAGVGKSYISEILNYKKRMSKKVIRNIADHFKIRQDALNKSYELQDEQNKGRSKTEKKAAFSAGSKKESNIYDFEPGKTVSYEEDEEVYAAVTYDSGYSIAK